jgi:glycosyltransferase involved in cell wall biosynthesis
VAAFSAGTVNDESREFLIGKTFGQKLHAFLSRITGLQGYYSSWSTKKLLRFMDRYQPDVVVLRNLHANYVHLPMLLKYLAKKDIPTVAVLHDCWFYTGKCCHYTVTGCYRWQESCGNCPAKKDYNTSWIWDRSRKMLQDKEKGFRAIPRLAVVAVSDWMLTEARKTRVFADAVSMQRIYNWVDREKFRLTDSHAARKALGLGDEKLILCVAGTWDAKKGIHTVKQLATKLDDRERIVLVGSVQKGIQLPENVIHIPKTGNVDRLVELYNAADVFLQPSLEETFGKVSSEALACGTPVVCFDSTANPELVGENCGAVVPAGDLDGMLQALRQILAQGKAHYSESCREFAKENFDMKKSLDQYMQLFSWLQNQTSKKDKEAER